MHRSSESIGALAAALAKAQAELTNPEKSLTATLHVPGTRAGERSFKYAPLASGLDIIRKVLGKHEIAALQTTTIDAPNGMVHLSTMLAHASGEWISSEWPICPASEAASPQRMGAALTYARRYALFTLVGIAGEDDLDAPDLPASSPRGTPARAMEKGSTPPPVSLGNGQGKCGKPPLEAVIAGAELSKDKSAGLLNQLTRELEAIISVDDLTAWASRTIAVKNSLMRADAEAVERAFQGRAAEMRAGNDAEEWPAGDVPPAPSRAETTVRYPEAAPEASDNAFVEAPNTTVNSSPPCSDRVSQQTPGIDKSQLAISEPKRFRDKAHLKFVAGHACLICGREPSDPHHLRFAQPRALARKVSDEFVVPLCRTHHRDVHRASNESAWWEQYNLEPLAVAATLWARSHGLG